MSSLHSDKGWLFVSFMLAGKRVRLYLGMRDNRTSRRSQLLKDVRTLIQTAQWGALARRYPRCKELAGFRAPVASAVTLAEVCAAFIAQKELSKSAGTADYYRSIVATHLTPSPLAAKPIRAITTNDIIALVGTVQKAGHAARAGKVRQTFSAIFRFAMAERGANGEYLVDENPTRRTDAIKATVRDPNPFTPDEQRRIVAAAREGWEARIVAAEFGTGMRPAELFGLKRKNVDLGSRKIHVRQNLTRHGEGELKTRKSHRTIDMSEPVHQALKAQFAAVQLKSEWLWPDTYHRKARPHSAHNFSRRNWPAILKRAGVEHREFLQCRHTFAITMLRNGADWDYIAEQMGTSIAMLQRHYWALLPGKARKPKPAARFI